MCNFTVVKPRMICLHEGLKSSQKMMKLMKELTKQNDSKHLKRLTIFLLKQMH